tara:strand:- start:1354 stop:2154 length:801 start_codon:yes stop_codon:yes gene_type:complete
MEVTISDKTKFTQFSNVFRYLPVFNMELVNINVSNKGMYIQGMDASQVCLFELKLQEEWFDSFKTDKSYVLGIHSLTFYKVIQCLEDNEQIMKMNYNDEDCLHIALENVNGSKKINKYFELPLVDIDMEMLDIPDTDYSIDMEIKSQSIANYIEQLLIFDETFTLSCNSDTINMKSKSESGSLTIEMSEENIMMYAVEDGMEKIEMCFALTYVKNMCAFSKITKSVVISLSENTPMRFHQSLDDVEIFENSESYIRLYLAPKLDED